MKWKGWKSSKEKRKREGRWGDGWFWWTSQCGGKLFPEWWESVSINEWERLEKPLCFTQCTKRMLYDVYESFARPATSILCSLSPASSAFVFHLVGKYWILHWKFLKRLSIITSDNDGGGISGQRVQTCHANNGDVNSCVDSSQGESEYDDETVVYETWGKCIWQLKGEKLQCGRAKWSFEALMKNRPNSFVCSFSLPWNC